MSVVLLRGLESQPRHGSASCRGGDGGIVTHRLAAGDTMIYSTATRHRWHHLGSETTRFVHVSAPG